MDVPTAHALCSVYSTPRSQRHEEQAEVSVAIVGTDIAALAALNACSRLETLSRVKVDFHFTI